MQKISTKSMAYMAVVAAVYAAITVSQAAIGFGPIQFRVAESLNLLAFFNPKFVPAVAMGVLIANFFSPYGLVDIVFGTGATLIALLLIRITRKTINNLLVASLWPTVVNALIIPLVFLTYYSGDILSITIAEFAPFALSVAIGQFVVVTIFGYTLVRILLAKNKNFMDIIEKV